jgi:hypothetical protein
MTISHRATPFARRLAGVVIALATTAVVVGAGAVPAGAATGGTRTDRVCQTQTAAGLSASVYTVCLTAQSSWNGASAAGYVAGTYCNVSLPTGAGWMCGTERHGAYWNGSLGAWEEWLNYKLIYLSPVFSYQVHYANCVYLRVDTRPSGYTTYQSFAVKNLSTSATC